MIRCQEIDIIKGTVAGFWQHLVINSNLQGHLTNVVGWILKSDQLRDVRLNAGKLVGKNCKGKGSMVKRSQAR